MRFRLPSWLILLLLAALCAGLIFLVAFLRSRRSSPADLIARLPADDAVILYLDFNALRNAGVLELFAESRLVQEPEYRAFVDQSGFDYRLDLDTAALSFHRDGNFFLLRGRFDWRMLNDFVTRMGGSCYNTFCQVQGSAPERNISYFPVQPDVMALAVSSSARAASRMQTRGRAPGVTDLPDQPISALIPASFLRDNQKLPAGARLFAKALEGADRIILSAGPAGGRLELSMQVSCRSEQDAAALGNQLGRITATLREVIARENRKPDPGDLSGLLTSGVFTHRGRRVFGRWPLERAFLETLAGSAL